MAASPVAVEYEITELGRSQQDPFKALYAWTMRHFTAVKSERATLISVPLQRKPGDPCPIPR